MRNMVQTEVTGKNTEMGYLTLWLLISVSLLVGVGLIMVYSSSYILSGETYGNGHYLIAKQLIYLTISLFFCYILSKTKITFWLKYGIYFHLACIGLLLLTFLPGLGLSAKGAHRWLRLGSISFQPGELVKISIIMATIPVFEHFDRLGQRQKIFYGAAILAPLVILVLQPDFGTFFIVFLVLSFVAFISSFSRKYFYSFIVCGLISGIPILLSRSYRVSTLR